MHRHQHIRLEADIEAYPVSGRRRARDNLFTHESVQRYQRYCAALGLCARMFLWSCERVDIILIISVQVGGGLGTTLILKPL